NQAEVVALLQTLDAVLDRRGSPELLLRDAGRLLQFTLIPELREDHVPGGQRHDRQQDEYRAGDHIAAGPEGSKAVWVFGGDGVGGLIFHSFLESQNRGVARHLIVVLVSELE